MDQTLTLRRILLLVAAVLFLIAAVGARGLAIGSAELDLVDFGLAFVAIAFLV